MTNTNSAAASSATIQIDGEKLAKTTPRNTTVTEKFDYSDTDLVTVLYRYGDVPADYKQLLGALRFVGGVAKDVPGHVARQLENGTRTVILEDGREITRRAHFKANNLYVLPNNATPVDYARYAKIKVDNNKVAALLGAADIEQITRLLGTKGTNELIEKLVTERNKLEQK